MTPPDRVARPDYAAVWLAWCRRVLAGERWPADWPTTGDDPNTEDAWWQADAP